MIFFDSETCGFHGFMVLLQWAEDNGPVNLHSIWHERIDDTMDLLYKLVESDICGFNLSFDWFHVCKVFTTFERLPGNWYPIDHIDEVAKAEKEARKGPCLKPKSACDLMLHARKGAYQSTMDRKDIVIRRVPRILAPKLAKELDQQIQLKDIYFAKKKNRKDRWQLNYHENSPDFCDIVLKFKASSRLKDLARDALGATDILTMQDVEPEKKPVELGYAPFAMAVGRPGRWRGAWPDVIQFHITHWGFMPLARKYAEDDVIYTRGLYEYLGKPESGDDDSELACMVGAVRWKGYSIDIEGLKQLKEEASKHLFEDKKAIPTAPRPALKYITSVMSEDQQFFLQGSTNKITLEKVQKWTDDHGNPHPAAALAKKVLEARQAQYKIGIYNKLLLAERFHADFKVIGALSSRMSGNSDLNAQGIEKSTTVRSKFPLADPGYFLCGGDFSSFEITLADAYFNDKDLRSLLLEGKKIHGIFGTFVYPGKSYEDILASDGSDEFDMYTRSKSAVFALLYGGTAFTLQSRLGVSIEAAEDAVERFAKRFPGIGERRQEIYNDFCSMRQPNGIGTQVVWHDPKDYVESMFGFRRYFTLENLICKHLYTLANDLPKELANVNIKVNRRERVQTASGAVQSALYACAFSIQASNMRAAGNHIIQSSGATITKTLQRKIWDLQPCGIHSWIVQPMNIHDEVMCPVKEGHEEKVTQVVHETVESFRERVPLIGIDWKVNIPSWGAKK